MIFKRILTVSLFITGIIFMSSCDKLPLDPFHPGTGFTPGDKPDRPDNPNKPEWPGDSTGHHEWPGDSTFHPNPPDLPEWPGDSTFHPPVWPGDSTNHPNPPEWPGPGDGPKWPKGGGH